VTFNGKDSGRGQRRAGESAEDSREDEHCGQKMEKGVPFLEEWRIIYKNVEIP
jgi:hypothetical protein